LETDEVFAVVVVVVGVLRSSFSVMMRDATGNSSRQKPRLRAAFYEFVFIVQYP